MTLLQNSVLCYSDTGKVAQYYSHFINISTSGLIIEWMFFESCDNVRHSEITLQAEWMCHFFVVEFSWYELFCLLSSRHRVKYEDYRSNSQEKPTDTTRPICKILFKLMHANRASMSKSRHACCSQISKRHRLTHCFPIQDGRKVEILCEPFIHFHSPMLNPICRPVKQSWSS